VIVSTGRSGSSLLSAIMLDAGANFAMPTQDAWDPGSGALEHPLAVSAGWQFDLAWEIDGGRRYFVGYKYAADVRRSLAKRKLERLLAEADTVKGPNADHWVPYLPKMGYKPRIVVPYRSPLDVGRSFLMKSKNSWEETRRYYLRIYRNATLYVQSFGGCVIDGTDLTDPDETAWADALATVTDLTRETLLSARDKRLKPREKSSCAAAGPSTNATPTALSLGDPEAEAVYQSLHALKGLALPPSRQAERRFAYTPSRR
jgi:hypothetical protein